METRADEGPHCFSSPRRLSILIMQLHHISVLRISLKNESFNIFITRQFMGFSQKPKTYPNIIIFDRT